MALKRSRLHVVAQSRERVAGAHRREEVCVRRRARGRAPAEHVGLCEKLPGLRVGRVGERGAVEHVDGRGVVAAREGQLAEVDERALVLRVKLEHLVEGALGVRGLLQVHLGDGAVVEHIRVGLRVLARRRGDEERQSAFVLLAKEVCLRERVFVLGVLSAGGAAQVERAL